MTLSTISQRHNGTEVPCGIAADAGTGGIRMVLYCLLTGKYFGEPIEMSYSTTRTQHDPPRIEMNSVEMLGVYRAAFARIVDEQLPENGVIKAIANDGHMHAGAMLEQGGAIHLPMQMWNSPASATQGEFLRNELGWMLPDRTTVAQLLFAKQEHGDEWFSKFRMATTAAGLIGFRLTKNHGLDFCEHSGLGINRPESGELATELAQFFGERKLHHMFPNRLAPNKILGIVTPDGAAWLGVEHAILKQCVVAAPAGDQGAGRDGLGCDERHAGLFLGSSVGVTTETRCRPDGWQWTKGAAGSCFDPFMSPHGNFFNMGMINSGMRAMDPFITAQLSEGDYADRGEIYRKLGQQALALQADYHAEFYACFGEPDPSLGVSRAYESEGKQTPVLRYLMMVDQVAASIRRRLEALCAGSSLPSQLIVGGNPSKDDYLLQLLANGIGVDLLRPSGSEFASLNGMVDRGRLAEEIFGRMPKSQTMTLEDTRRLMREFRPEPSGEEFKSNSAQFARRAPYRKKLSSLLETLAS